LPLELCLPPVRANARQALQSVFDLRDGLGCGSPDRAVQCRSNTSSRRMAGWVTWLALGLLSWLAAALFLVALIALATRLSERPQGEPAESSRFEQDRNGHLDSRATSCFAPTMRRFYGLLDREIERVIEFYPSRATAEPHDRGHRGRASGGGRRRHAGRHGRHGRHDVTRL
jgi:hypothetical protein